MHFLMIWTFGLNLVESWFKTSVTSWVWFNVLRIFIIRTMAAWISILRSSSMCLWVTSCSAFCSDFSGKLMLMRSFLLKKRLNLDFCSSCLTWTNWTYFLNRVYKVMSVSGSKLFSSTSHSNKRTLKRIPKICVKFSWLISVPMRQKEKFNIAIDIGRWPKVRTCVIDELLEGHLHLFVVLQQNSHLESVCLMIKN